MSSVDSGKADQETRLGFKGALIGALSGLFAGVSISAVITATSGVTPTLSGAIANPFTATLAIIGVGIGYLEAVA